MNFDNINNMTDDDVILSIQKYDGELIKTCLKHLYQVYRGMGYDVKKAYAKTLIDYLDIIAMEGK